ncbi:hypothetical protein [Propylenella binzhouense]|uniref:Uncharacterized protein n=1 Tax=Propylenella binzhouense TaxID=2555902 RepID=A0A964T2E4_9HYPH|nr:hypothetical protein [Propylenella binzhouense]MYZ47158.1 hypothetical protein [Propylenella binzhouense]
MSARVRNELPAGKVLGDVWDGSPANPPFGDPEVTGEYVPEAAAAYPDNRKDADGHWTGICVYVT